jgi:hypothetical protein
LSKPQKEEKKLETMERQQLVFIANILIHLEDTAKYLQEELEKLTTLLKKYN